jgi:xanthine dehydrogenase large subunit
MNAPPPPAPALEARVVGAGIEHESARLHVTGEAAYTDDVPEPRGTLHAAVGMSPLAHGRIRSVDLAAVRAAPGVVAVITAADIPGVNDVGPIQHDDPILADGIVQFVGQPVFAVAATSASAARASTSSRCPRC